MATASNDDPVPSCLQSAGGRTVWYTFTSDSLIFLEASTEDSRPFEYNTVLAIFSGLCNSLVEIACNDDIVTSSFLQSKVEFRAEAGITYYIQVAESDAPGEGGEEAMGGDLKFILNEIPLFKGPQSGGIAGGDSVSTNDFTNTLSKKINRNKAPRNLVRARRLKKIVNRKPLLMSKTLPNSNFILDKKLEHLKVSGPVLQKGFPGIPDNGEVTPPDPVIAAGPNHLVALVNNEIGIIDKNSGEQLLLIDPGEWFRNVFRAAVPCNPQIVYDHFSARWVMLWIECSSAPEGILLSVSDDSNPLGKWCTWRLTPFPDGVAGGINDLPKLGFDHDAIYVTTNNFGLSAFVLVRIIPKNQLLNNDCGAITWTDFWDLRNPIDRTTPVLGTVPATTFGSPDAEYFVDIDFINETGSFINLWSISDPLNNPTLRGSSIEVSTFHPPPDADQLGGSDVPLEILDGRNHNAVFRNGSVWTAHSIADATGRFAQARYFRIDVNTATILEDVAFGKENFWYMYPVVMVDENENLFMSFTRSGLTEYPNARYTGRLNSDPPGLQASILLKAGEDNYLKTFGSGRNPWGFYNGIALDPADNNVVWMLTQYAAQPVGPEPDDDRWGTWIGKASFVPQSGVKIVVDPQEYDFNLMFFRSANNQPLPITISSTGDETLILTNISLLHPSQGAFKLEGLPQFPLNLASFGDFQFSVCYDPVAGEAFTDSVFIQSNDPENSGLYIKLTGIVPGILNVDSEFLDVSIEAGQTTTRSINIKNPGGLDLELRVGFTGIAEYTPESASRSENSFSKESNKDKLRIADSEQIHDRSQNIEKHTDLFQESSMPDSGEKKRLMI
ncbi:hypothetical protein IH785_18185 [candidate division KSB1 bacterium]|nr:hypothetical protein [candidate division KSB1 bacterium]